MSKGIFNKEQTKSNHISQRGTRISCTSCGLYTNCRSPRMTAYGKGHKGILNVGEAPSGEDDQKGKQWQGRTGRKLKLMYESFGIDLFEDCLNINAVNCMPTDNETPTSHQIDCCRPRVMKTIEEFQPRIIILYGQSAVESVLGERWQKNRNESIATWRGYHIPDQRYKAFVCPTFHPSYVYRGDPDVRETIWFQDIENALQCLNRDFQKLELSVLCGKIEIVEDQKQLSDTLGMLSIVGGEFKADLRAVDIESTGLKPDAPGHQIACLSIALNSNKSYVFPMTKRDQRKEQLRKLLMNQWLGWIGHNIKFEQRWFRKFLNAEPINWVWDTMMYAHRQRSTKGTKSLKFQTYVNFGIADYDSEVEPYLKGDPQDANSFNRVMELMEKNPRQLMLYCGLDTIFTYRLAELQMKGAE